MKVRQTLFDVVNRVRSHSRQSRAKERRTSILSTAPRQNGPNYAGTALRNNALKKRAGTFNNVRSGPKSCKEPFSSLCHRTNCAGICIWIGSLVFLTCGLVQFIAGAYFLTTLHVFHLGSNIWTGIWAVICALLTVYMYGTFSRTSNGPEPSQTPNSGRRHGKISRRTRHYIIFGLCLSMMLVNLVNLIVTEVLERPAAEHRNAENYSEGVFHTVRLACTGMTGTAMVTGLVIAGIVYYIFLRNSNTRTSAQTIFDLPPKRKNQQRSGDWVFRMEDVTNLEPTTTNKSSNYHDALMETSSERTATIRRAPSLLLSLPESSAVTEHLCKRGWRNSLRSHVARKPTKANVQRSQTMRELSHNSSTAPAVGLTKTVNFSASTCDVKAVKHEGYYVRLSSKFDYPDSELGFVADSIESKTVPFSPPRSHLMSPPSAVHSSRLTCLAEDQASTNLTPESIKAAVNPKQAPERIVLRVESMKSPYRDPFLESKWARVRQCERTSSSTQTDLSSLAGKPGVGCEHVVTQRSSTIKKRPAPTRPITPPPTQIAYSTPTLALPVSEPSLDLTEEGTRSPIDSSSGYSSPHDENRSKMSTPEPAATLIGDGDKQLMHRSTTTALPPLPAQVFCVADGVTVIKIDTAHDSTWNRDCHQTYDIPRKLYPAPATHSTRYRSENVVPLLPRSPRRNVPHFAGDGEVAEYHQRSPRFQVRIKTNPAVSRSVSFQHQRKAHFTSEQRYHLPGIHRPSPDRLRNIQEERPLNRKVGRSSSVSVAVAEIERRLEYLRTRTSEGSSYANSQAPSSQQSSLGTDSSSPETSVSTSHYNDANRCDRMNPSLGQDLAEVIDNTETLAYLSELELLARHWRSQLLYRQLDLQAKSQRFVKLDTEDSFEC